MSEEAGPEREGTIETGFRDRIRWILEYEATVAPDFRGVVDLVSPAVDLSVLDGDDDDGCA
jgi:hypothetical protein